MLKYSVYSLNHLTKKLLSFSMDLALMASLVSCCVNSMPPTLSSPVIQSTSIVNLYTSTIVNDLIDFAQNQQRQYTYELVGADSAYFEIESNTIKTTNEFGFRSIYENNGEYRFQINYITDYGSSVPIYVRETILSVTVKVHGWSQRATNQNIWRARDTFQTVVLSNNDILVMGGFSGSFRNDIWSSSDEGRNWNNITVSAPWRMRHIFQAVLLSNDDILVMGGTDGEFRFNDVWLSDDGGTNWNQIPASNHWMNRGLFQAVVLTNDDILVMGGALFRGVFTNDVWVSRDRGTNWSLINGSAPWPVRGDFQAVVLANNDVLIMGGEAANSRVNDVWISRDGGTNWNQIPVSNHWNPRQAFQSVILANDDILVMGGFGNDHLNDSWLSTNGGTNWSQLPASNHWTGRISFEAVVLTNNQILILGGINENLSLNNDIWFREEYNTNYF